MSGTFYDGEKKDRAGAYFTYKNVGARPTASAVNGKAAILIQAGWGPICEVNEFESPEEIELAYGKCESVDKAKEVLYGGAQSLLVVRVGKKGDGAGMGSEGRTNLSGTPVRFEKKDEKEERVETKLIKAIEIVMKCKGDRKFDVRIRESIEDKNKKELAIFEDGCEREKLTFEKYGTNNKEGKPCNNEAQLLMEAYDQIGSKWFTLKYILDTENAKLTAADKWDETENFELPNINAGDMVAIKGTRQEKYDVSDYEEALGLLETRSFNVITVDTDEKAVHLVLASWADRMFNEGVMPIVVIGISAEKDIKERIQYASSFNSFKVVCFGDCFKNAAGITYDGSLAFARIAGMVAGIPANDSLTHKSISGAVELPYKLKNSDQKDAIKNGLMTLSTNKSGSVIWIESGINTLVEPEGQDDEGWKKIRRVKERIELINRIISSTEPMIGSINNDEEGRSIILQVANGVAKEMVAERKLSPEYEIGIDPDRAPEGDSAWFYIRADDTDSAEKMYFTFRFRYSAA